MADYCENCEVDILEEEWEKGTVSACSKCDDTYCEECEGNSGDICTECGDWVCFNCSLQCNIDEVVKDAQECTSWGCEEHFTTIEVNNESKYICEHCYEKYKKVFIEKGYIDE